MCRGHPPLAGQPTVRRGSQEPPGFDPRFSILDEDRAPWIPVSSKILQKKRVFFFSTGKIFGNILVNPTSYVYRLDRIVAVNVYVGRAANRLSILRRRNL